jgi:hypothetical protein
MTKRSAFTLAAALAGTLLVGAIAISLMSGGVSHAQGHTKPRVKHRVHTVTIRRTEPPSPAAVRTIDLGGTGTTLAPTSTEAGYGSEDEYEDEDEGSEEASFEPHEMEPLGDD